ncbi:MAG: hypothetical protein ACE5EG_03270 [Thermoanaerobaculia bacterium]
MKRSVLIAVLLVAAALVVALVSLHLAGPDDGRRGWWSVYEKQILTSPPDAQVILDGRTLGRSLLRLRLAAPAVRESGRTWEREWFEPGRSQASAGVGESHVLEIRKDGYRTVTFSFATRDLVSTIPDSIPLVWSE